MKKLRLREVTQDAEAAQQLRGSDGALPSPVLPKPVSAGVSEPFLGKKLDVHFLNVCDSCELFHDISILILIQKYVLYPLPPETKINK